MRNRCVLSAFVCLHVLDARACVHLMDSAPATQLAYSCPPAPSDVVMTAQARPLLTFVPWSNQMTFKKSFQRVGKAPNWDDDGQVVALPLALREREFERLSDPNRNCRYMYFQASRGRVRYRAEQGIGYESVQLEPLGRWSRPCSVRRSAERVPTPRSSQSQ